jgi:AraC family transcriptional regulator, regulatory protein of adaptative response / methylated-DNA-[protein]-cysteine methyltransferase
MIAQSIRMSTISPQEIRDEQMWRAVLARDEAHDGRFVYAVGSTGIYCRPTCPSRRPSRDKVEFFSAPAEAEGAGYRACKRCHPNGRGHDHDADLVAQVTSYIEENVGGERPLTLEALSEHVGLSPFHLQRVFKRVVGVSPRQYADEVRLQRTKEQLRERDGVAEAIYEAGYGSSSRLYETAGERLGMTPGEYKRGGEWSHISYTLAPCPLGWLLVAATERGLCAVRLGDSETQLEETLREEFPAAAITRDGESLDRWVRPILSYLSGEMPNPDLPVHVRSTAFQRRVWEMLRQIPYGTTQTYGELAAGMGMPTATRAVARACATNPVALVVPCHRVVGADGKMRGYRWGSWRKEQLLQMERDNEGVGGNDKADLS